MSCGVCVQARESVAIGEGERGGGNMGYFGFFTQNDLGRWNDPMVPDLSLYF